MIPFLFNICSNDIYALGLFADAQLRPALVEAAQRDALTLICVNDDSDQPPFYYWSLHPTLDTWYIKTLLPVAVHSMDAEHLLRNFRHVSSQEGTKDIGTPEPSNM